MAHFGHFEISIKFNIKSVNNPTLIKFGTKVQSRALITMVKILSRYSKRKVLKIIKLGV